MFLMLQSFNTVPHVLTMSPDGKTIFIVVAVFAIAVNHNVNI